FKYKSKNILKNKKSCKRFFGRRLGLNIYVNLRELISKLSLALNNPFGMNMHISYDNLLESTLDDYDYYINLINEIGEDNGKK
ncbi:MAG: hypothetical protein ACRC1R_00410, partial [Cetobacterium sp.]|uniref:hypothetical protein n=1 Tax=Cetobacterium sp. TaxID=2071632 RepID=UPI003F40A5F9